MGERGQALLIVLLVMTVALTVGLSIATRTIVNVRIAVREEQSQRAFSAAEAGIEETLRNCTVSSCTPADPPAGGFTNNTTFVVPTPVLIGGNQILVNGGESLQQDEGAQVWLSSFGSSTGTYSGTLTLYWGLPSEACNDLSALEVIVISGSKISPSLLRFALDPCSRSNNFTSVSGGAGSISGVAFRNSFTISVTSGLIMRVVPLYKGSPVGISATAALPPQGVEITSIGSTLDPNPVVRKIRVFNPYPHLPATLFNYTLFSGSGASLSQ